MLHKISAVADCIPTRILWILHLWERMNNEISTLVDYDVRFMIFLK